MALAINIDELIHGKVIEWERLEFKKSWNPEDVIHSLSAFANDINNWGGGYIIIGIAEENGGPILPPSGLNMDQLDKIQGELTKLCHLLQPNYMPIVQPTLFHGQHILVIYAPAGDMRPYAAPEALGEKGLKNRAYYIRSGSRSIKATGANFTRLQELTARIPFDDRINQQAALNDLDLGLIRDFLHEVKSDLAEVSATLPFADLCRQMNIAKGPDEALRPVNAGLLFFSQEPERFFERAWIEVVIRNDEAGKDFSEKYFKGPLHIQLRNALSFIRNNFIAEKVRKISGQAEARRFYNFPYDALEEALANAVFHKSYELGKPIELQLWPDRIEILSFPGPVPPVTAKILAENQRIVARDYRNRRLGDFLKELHLTEGRGTGIPTIHKTMRDNASPAPLIETDEACTYFLTVLPVNEEFKVQGKVTKNGTGKVTKNGTDGVSNQASNEGNDQVNDQVSDQVNDQVSAQVSVQVSDQVKPHLKMMLKTAIIPLSRRELLAQLGLKNHFDNFKKHILPLIEIGLLELEHPDNPNHPNQKYRTTPRGKEYIKNATK